MLKQLAVSSLDFHNIITQRFQFLILNMEELHLFVGMTYKGLLKSRNL